MNKVNLFVLAVTLLFASGCVKETEQQSELMKVGVSLDELQTKTYLDPNESAVRQVYWSEGDAVNVNGIASLPLAEQFVGQKVADFLCYSGSAPFNVIYPASVCDGYKYAADGTIRIDVPSRQEYSPTSFGKGAAILYGYGEQLPVTLQNLCGAVRVTLKDASTKIRKASLISNGSTEAIAGTFNLNPKTGEFTVVSGLNSIDLNIEEVSLNEEGQSFYFMIPKGFYPGGFTFRFYSETGEAMECRWLDDKNDEVVGVKVEASRLYQFKPVDFTSGGMKVLSAEDWVYIAEQINAGTDNWKKYLDGVTNTVRLGEDLVLPDDAPVINEFAAVLDGCGHTVRRENMVAPLVKTLKGTIRNLNVAGEATVYQIPSEDGGLAAVVPFVEVLDGGVLENCVNNMNVTIASSVHDAVFAGFVKQANGGQLKNCVNNGNISFSTNSKIAYGGGFIGAASPASRIEIEDCTNNGAVSLMILLEGANTNNSSKYVGLGGIIGRIESGNAENYVRIYNCTNNGELIINSSAVTTLGSSFKYQNSLGGIVGLAAGTNGSLLTNPVSNGYAYLEIESCSNTARLHNNMLSRCGSHDIDSKIYSGGIAGSMFGLKGKPALIKNCVNTGDVIPHEGTLYARQAFCGVCGGIIGIGGYVTVEGGKVQSKVGTLESYSYAQAGVIGMAFTKFMIAGMEVNPQIHMAETKTYSIGNYALAVTSSDKLSATWKSLAGSTIENCRLGGSLNVLAAPGTYSSSKVDTGSLAGRTALSVTGENFRSYIVGSSYTGTDIIVAENNQFMN